MSVFPMVCFVLNFYIIPKRFLLTKAYSLVWYFGLALYWLVVVSMYTF